ncbi:hypothetical protein Pan258_27680 [Symmachiella dynata]|uniref:hypothetical protein n=1 Tax=Symmachiella dynata TaxID=2527995 RepID=UPI00118A98A8|nr:hypothetical protein [Symmachiella dynata]QDT48723.1 hypothetical protein Pan258_27680 [Symmachiella dynata]
MSHEDKPCPDCDGTLKAVRLIDNDFGRQREVEYTVPDAKKDFGSSRFPIEGKVAAFLCDSCGRMLFYGQSKE